MHSSLFHFIQVTVPQNKITLFLYLLKLIHYVCFNFRGAVRLRLYPLNLMQLVLTQKKVDDSLICVSLKYIF